MNNISIEDFFKTDRSKLQVIDIREHYEYLNGHIESINIPMGEILNSLTKIDSKKQVILYCQTGRRAAAAVYMLQKKYNLNHVFNLTGGYEAYVNFTSN